MEALSFFIVISALSGFLTCVGTEIVLGKEKAKMNPGGSLFAGMMACAIFQAATPIIYLGAVFGVLGWIFYRILWPAGS